MDPHPNRFLYICIFVQVYIRLRHVVSATFFLLVAIAPANALGQIVVASVRSEPIFEADVRRQLSESLGNLQVEPGVFTVLRAEMLSQLIDRRLIVNYLSYNKWVARPAEVEQKLEQLKQELAGRNQTLDDYLKKTGHTEASLRRQVVWRTSWQRYLDDYLTEKRIQHYFEENRRQFDGTKIHVAHILIKPIRPDDDSAISESVRRATKIRDEIAGQKLSFADAAAKHSAAPSAQKSGDIGFISRREPMPESFSSVAFRLVKGEVSPPVVTRLGVHLIQCLGIQPGTRKLDDVRELVTEAATRERFKSMAGKLRSGATIEFTGEMPYFRPGTRELIE